jgi:hypothetical protein
MSQEEYACTANQVESIEWQPHQDKWLLNASSRRSRRECKALVFTARFKQFQASRGYWSKAFRRHTLPFRHTTITIERRRRNPRIIYRFNQQCGTEGRKGWLACMANANSHVVELGLYHFAWSARTYTSSGVVEPELSIQGLNLS